MAQDPKPATRKLGQIVRWITLGVAALVLSVLLWLAGAFWPWLVLVVAVGLAVVWEKKLPDEDGLIRWVAIVFLFIIALIAILTLLGPAIGRALNL